ncbi:solute carrier family 22 member 16 [Meriones unguiculatus]|uniref:solute carrier family 22 member 16 n=1 Tax=Meriones unguiculatus TaxID=10047 RepID=UPI000B4FAC7B|nr:solute carrier family 22 member 16 [Meriones unguiculatus]
MESYNVELIFDHVGHFGRFQMVLYLICAYQSISCGIHYLSSIFISVVPEHICRPPGKVWKAVFHNLSARRLEDILALRSPDQKDHITVELQDGEIWELTRCSRTWRENASHSAHEYSGHKQDNSCSDGYVYDQSKWGISVVRNLNLVCDQKWYANMIQPLFLFGILLGAIIFGYLSDRFGRRGVLWCTSLCLFLFGMASLLLLDFFSFMAVRFFLSMAASGYYVVVVVYVMEFIGKKARVWLSMHLHTFFAVGVILVILVNYLVKTWWLYQIVLWTVTVPFILCCWMLPETPFWLLSEGRYKEAQGLIDAMAQWNESSSCDLVELFSLDVNSLPDKNHQAPRKHGLAELFRNRDITRRTLIVWLVWTTAYLGYYIFSVETVWKTEYNYMYLFIVGIVDIPAYSFICVWLKRVGRRKTVFFFLSLASLTCAAYLVLPLKHNNLKIVAVLVVKVIVGLVVAFLYLYTAELYPTIVRCLALGSSNMVARIASLIIPNAGQLTKAWIFLPQILFGILAILSGLLSLMLPETQNKPMTSTWEPAAQQVPESKDLSSEAPPEDEISEMENRRGSMDVINLVEFNGGK